MEFYRYRILKDIQKDYADIFQSANWCWKIFLVIYRDFEEIYIADFIKKSIFVDFISVPKNVDSRFYIST